MPTKTENAAVETKPKSSNSDSTPPQNEWSKREIGALWKRTGKTQEYLGGHVRLADGAGEERQIFIQVFTNKQKKSNSHPDFRVYLSDSKPGQEKPSSPFSLSSDSADKLTPDRVSARGNATAPQSAAPEGDEEII
jgi:uncharacterized protein (DUF736 family)